MLNLTLYPILVATQSVPKVAIAPIILVWFGLGIESKLAIAFLVAFFPIVVDTATGLQSTPAGLLELARSLRASPLQVFAKVQFPAALPFIFSGAKVAVTLAVIGAVIGEFVGSMSGLGNLLLTANSQLDSALAWAALVWLSILGILLFAAVALAERLLMPWAGRAGHVGLDAHISPKARDSESASCRLPHMCALHRSRRRNGEAWHGPYRRSFGSALLPAPLHPCGSSRSSHARLCRRRIARGRRW